MSIWDIIFLILIAGFCGSLAQAMVGFSRGGCLVSIVLGFIGALIGSGLARAFELPEPFAIEVGDRTFPLLWSIIGAALFVAILSFITPRRRVID